MSDISGGHHYSQVNIRFSFYYLLTRRHNCKGLWKYLKNTPEKFLFGHSNVALGCQRKELSVSQRPFLILPHLYMSTPPWQLPACYVTSPPNLISLQFTWIFLFDSPTSHLQWEAYFYLTFPYSWSLCSYLLSVCFHCWLCSIPIIYALLSS